MNHLIEENKFEELKEALRNLTEYKIHSYFLDILNYKTVEIDGESFSAKRYQEEFLEGLNIFEALTKSKIDKTQLDSFLNILEKLAFKMGGFIQIMSQTALNNGIYLSDIEDMYKVHPLIRQRLQDYIDLLKTSGNYDVSVANLTAAKIKITLSIQNLLEKFEIGEDMLQLAQAYEVVDQTEMAINTYEDILMNFESESVTSSSGLFPEITYVDLRPESEIKIFEIAKNNFERLTDQKRSEPKRIQINESKIAEDLAYEMKTTIKQTTKNNESGFLDKLKRLFKKN